MLHKISRLLPRASIETWQNFTTLFRCSDFLDDKKNLILEDLKNEEFLKNEDDSKNEGNPKNNKRQKIFQHNYNTT